MFGVGKDGVVLRRLTVEPTVHGRLRLCRERNLAIGATVSARHPRLAAQILAATAAVQVIQHQAYFSSSRPWSASRARCTRIFNAPTVVPSRSAISSYDRPSTCFMMNASRSEGA